MNIYNLTKEEIQTISKEQIRSIDKMYRMHFGISSELIDVKEGVLFIAVKVHREWLRRNTPLQTAQRFIKSWKSHCVLCQASGCHVNVFLTNRIAGFALPTKDFEKQAKHFKRLMNVPEKLELLLSYHEFYN